MVRKFTYRGITFTATIHGHAGKEELFIVENLDDGTEGHEKSIDRFEDADNDPNMCLEDALVKLTNQLIAEESMELPDPAQDFSWIEAKVLANVHNGLQH